MHLKEWTIAAKAIPVINALIELKKYEFDVEKYVSFNTSFVQSWYLAK